MLETMWKIFFENNFLNTISQDFPGKTQFIFFITYSNMPSCKYEKKKLFISFPNFNPSREDNVIEII